MEKIDVEEAIREWDIEDFICKICLWCDYYLVKADSEEEFRKHLLKEHKEEIKEHYNYCIK